MTRGRVMVLGSANMDLVVRAPRFPEAGETLLGGPFDIFPGGKGANQAAAVGRLGGRPRFMAKVGSDSFGRELISALGTSGVDTGSLLMDPAYPTGVALITVAEDGRNTIVVAPGANKALTAEEAVDAIEEIGPGILLAQLEIPPETVLAAAKALPPEAVFILNPAPARELPAALLERVDFITPNETETETLTGVWPTNAESCARAAEWFIERGAKNVVITLGAQGCFLSNGMFVQDFAALAVDPVDTTAAGDAFNGALAHFLSEGRDVGNAVELANVAGALSTLKRGAIASMPTLREVMRAP